MDARTLTALDDEDYEQLIIRNAHPPARNADIWAALTHPDNINRTRERLAAVHQRAGNNLRKKKAERDVFGQECHARGEAGKREWFATRGEYEDWRRRAANFHQTMQRALSELGKIHRQVNRDANAENRNQHRQALRELAVAVQRHQALHMRSGERPGQADYELWQLLGSITVPYGPDQAPTTLRTMLEFCWTDVHPVDDGEEERAVAERTMRTAPAGRAAQFTGSPRARHVGNRKDLAS